MDNFSCDFCCNENEITSRYVKFMRVEKMKIENRLAKTRVPKNLLVKIISDVKTKHNIYNDVIIKSSTIRGRTLHSNILSNKVGGHRSPTPNQTSICQYDHPNDPHLPKSYPGPRLCTHQRHDCGYLIICYFGHI